MDLSLPAGERVYRVDDETRVSGPDERHLERDGDYFELWVRIEDAVYAGSADPPDETPSCGLL
ncbi:hypothetical protein [Halospeciosus flavus]|nr:hypothetical protein [Halospeciosus flavus]